MASHSRLRIAIVEDNPDNRLLLRAMLSGRCEIDEYATGQEALDGLRRSPPDLVLMDISLPGMDGLEVLSRLRADGATSRLPVIAITAHAMAGDREKALEAGCNDYDTKPVELPRLLAKIEALLSGSK